MLVCLSCPGLAWKYPNINWGEPERAPHGQFNEKFVCLSVRPSVSYVSVKLESFRKLNATHARSVQHHVQFGQFFPTVKRFVVESI